MPSALRSILEGQKKLENNGKVVVECEEQLFFGFSRIGDFFMCSILTKTIEWYVGCIV